MSRDLDQGIEVEICKQIYRIRSDKDPEYIKQLAEYVDQKMNEVLDRTLTVDSLKVAVLTALNIADEYYSTREELIALDGVVRSKSEKMNALLEPVLNAASPL